MTSESDFCAFPWLKMGKLADGGGAKRIKAVISVTISKYFRGFTFTAGDSPVSP